MKVGLLVGSFSIKLSWIDLKLLINKDLYFNFNSFTLNYAKNAHQKASV